MYHFKFLKSDVAFQLNALAIGIVSAKNPSARPRNEPRLERTSAACAARRIRARTSIRDRSWLRRWGILAIAVSWLNGTVATAQSRSLPSHGKTKLDSYNYLLRDVHPASQAEANYLQNRLFLSDLKKSERLERNERLDVYELRQFIERLQNYHRLANRLSAGRPTTARDLNKFWMLVSLYGDYAEVYQALVADVPPMPHDQFVPTRRFISILQPGGKIERPPLLLEAAAGVDADELQLAWKTLVQNEREMGQVAAADVVRFSQCVDEYRRRADAVVAKVGPIRGRLAAKKYLRSLGALADAFYRPQQLAQIQQYLRQGGIAFCGGSLLELCQHMLRNRAMPAQGSSAQLALAEAARPICRLLDAEIAVRVERVDSLAVGEGHRPYLKHYGASANKLGAVPGTRFAAGLD